MMKISRMALSAALACACFAAPAFGQQGYRGATSYQKTAYSYGYNEGEASPSDAAPAPAPEAAPAAMEAAPVASCDTGSACDTACDEIGGCGCSGDPWKLFDGDICGWTIGGWTNVGYHTANNAGGGILAARSPANFNNYADRVQLQQQWLYFEKVADGSCGLDLGGRVDYVYGTDAPDTQAFGIANTHWDNQWDNGGAYGHSLPQVYGEVAYGDLSAKVGHFFTIIGNEVVQATGNFFYSRQFTFYNSEPFTHTGALTTYNVSDDLQVYNGYVTGWDSGFEDNGDAYIGGFKSTVSDRSTFIYTLALGRFNENQFTNFGPERGEIHSTILTTSLTDKLTHIAQADYLHTNNQAGVGLRNTFGFINYLIYQVNDCWSVGQRFEWYNVSSEFQAIQNADTYNYTAGLNYKLNSNLVIRPEVRWIWDKERLGLNENAAGSATVFGMDAVFTF